MKKRIKFLCLVFFIIPLCFFLFSCSHSLEEQVSSCVSEYRENYFYVKAENFTASFTDGEREREYIYNGEKTSLVDYGIIVVKTNVSVQGKLKFELSINDEIFVGEMDRNPFDQTFVFDIERRVSSGDNIELYLVDFDVRLTLSCLSKDWGLTCGKALTKFVYENKAGLQAYVSNDCFQGEVYIKLVADIDDENNIYYYVLAVCKDGQVFGSLFDVKTGILVQK
ncbi:MAG: hypothetical protein EOM55_03925 [Clostridia bacterium]|nr:hypothetical protein [Clostridia bacterium]